MWRHMLNTTVGHRGSWSTTSSPHPHLDDSLPIDPRYRPAAPEPIIDQLKAGHRMHCNYLAHSKGAQRCARRCRLQLLSTAGPRVLELPALDEQRSAIMSWYWMSQNS